MIKPILVDFTSAPLPSREIIGSRIVRRGLIIGKFQILTNSGIAIGTPHLSLAVHDGEPFELTWTLQKNRRINKNNINIGQFGLLPPDEIIHVDWAGNQQIFGVAFTDSFIERNVAEAFDGGIPKLQPLVAAYNPAISRLIDCLRQGMEEAGRINLLYLDHIGAILALKLYELYGETNSPISIGVGGLSSFALRRVVDYIDAHLEDEMTLGDLAAEARLSPHHFSRAFRITLGTSPYRYVNKQRILRAQQLLLDPDRSITDIGLSLGFSSHSHFTNTFRKLTSITPSQFRRDRV